MTAAADTATAASVTQRVGFFQLKMFLIRLLTLLSHESVRKEYRLAILARRGLRERVMTYLTMQAQKRGAASVTIPFSREELASFLCVNRSALSHELSCMARDGLITFHKNRFTLGGWQPSQSREEDL